jgi:hypothetical protein
MVVAHLERPKTTVTYIVGAELELCAALFAFQCFGRHLVSLTKNLCLMMWQRSRQEDSPLTSPRL